MATATETTRIKGIFGATTINFFQLCLSLSSNPFRSLFKPDSELGLPDQGVDPE
jgi:hypothetical protein